MNRQLIFPVLLSIITLASCAKHETVAAAKELTSVRAWTVQPAVLATELRYGATIEPLTQVTLSFRTPGVVESIHRVKGIDGRPRALETGDFVPSGAVLATIRSTEYRARTDAAMAQWSDAKASRIGAVAQVAEAQAALTQAELDWGRAQKLLAGQAMTKAEADAARARYDSARSRVDAARAQVAAVDAKVEAANATSAESKVGLSDTVLTAPFGAWVVSRQVERGAYAQPGAPAFVLADLSKVKVVFQAPDTALARFRPGAAVKVTVETLGGAEVDGTVQSVSPVADPVTRNFRVEAIAANPGRKLSAGLVASVTMPDEAAGRVQPQLTIPVSALMRASSEGADFAVFVIQGQTVRRRTVRLGEAKGNDVAILAGLQANDKVVRDGVSRLKDGENVLVVE